MADGTYRWHLSRAVPVLTADGSTMKWFGTATDVHAQKLAEEHQASIAHTLQQALMPTSLPTSPAFDLAARLPGCVGRRRHRRRLVRRPCRRALPDVDHR